MKIRAAGDSVAKRHKGRSEVGAIRHCLNLPGTRTEICTF